MVKFAIIAPPQPDKMEVIHSCSEGGATLEQVSKILPLKLLRRSGSDGV
jgi:hypothetical protein